MKRAMAGVLLLLVAACGGSDGDDQTAEIAQSVEATSPTTGFAFDPEEGFREAVETRAGLAGSQADAAVTMVEAMCDMLDTTDASEASGTLADAGLQVMFSEWDGPASELAQVLVLGSEYFCPDHKSRITSYMSEQGIAPRP